MAKYCIMADVVFKSGAAKMFVGKPVELTDQEISLYEKDLEKMRKQVYNYFIERSISTYTIKIDTIVINIAEVAAINLELIPGAT